jgi:hypothetical protein
LHESFQVEPKMGWADPLETYFGSIGAIGGSFPSGLAVLSAKPTTVPLDLNEWVRFDRPGVYSVTVTSHRVSQPSKGSPFGQGDVPLQSELLKLRIVPASRKWQAVTLAQALDALRANPPAANGMLVAKREEAIAVLRYLGTAGAIAALAQHLRDDEPDLEFPFAFGLMGVSPRMVHVALATLEAQMARPEFPVPGERPVADQGSHHGVGRREYSGDTGCADLSPGLRGCLSETTGMAAVLTVVREMEGAR